MLHEYQKFPFHAFLFLSFILQIIMDQSIQFAKETISNIRNSIAYGKRSGYYAQMDAESENEEDDHSLFYSIHQNNNQDSIPLTLSNTYSDRSQLVFSQDFEEENFVSNK